MILFQIEIVANLSSAGGNMQGMGAGGARGRQQALFPVQVMMPIGPQGAWQPVQYMMTAQQVFSVLVIDTSF